MRSFAPFNTSHAVQIREQRGCIGWLSVRSDQSAFLGGLSVVRWLVDRDRELDWGRMPWTSETPVLRESTGACVPEDQCLPVIDGWFKTLLAPREGGRIPGDQAWPVCYSRPHNE